MDVLWGVSLLNCVCGCFSGSFLLVCGFTAPGTSESCVSIVLYTPTDRTRGNGIKQQVKSPFLSCLLWGGVRLELIFSTKGKLGFVISHLWHFVKLTCQ